MSLWAQIATGFVQAGARVYVASRKIPDGAVSDLNALGQASGGRAFPISADLSTLEGVDKVVQAIKHKEGKLHVLVNNGKYTLHLILLAAEELTMPCPSQPGQTGAQRWKNTQTRPSPRC